jgi:hypothetical protein
VKEDHVRRCYDNHGATKDTKDARRKKLLRIFFVYLRGLRAFVVSGDAFVVSGDTCIERRRV